MVAAAAHVAMLASSSGGHPGGVEGWLLHFRGLPAYVLVCLLAFGEAALMVGFFIPGETAVVVGGVLAGLGRVNLELIMALVVVCAVVGDSVGYEVGRQFGPWLLDRRPLRGRSAVQRTVALLERYGGPAVFLGRFLAFARAVIPGLAGMSGLRYRTFLFFNALGGLLWGVGYTLLGYVVGVSFGHLLRNIGIYSVAIVAGIAVLAVGVHLVLRRRRRGADQPTTEPATGGAAEPATGGAAEPATGGAAEPVADPAAEAAEGQRSEG